MNTGHGFFLDKAEYIARYLLNMAKVDGDKMYWENLAENGDAVYFITSGSLYAGNAGIALFWCELYQHTRKPEYKDVLIKTMNWVLNEEQYGVSDVSLYFGSAGIIYCCCRVAEVLEEEIFLEKAYTIFEHTNYESHTGNDLMGGISGTMLALTYLYRFRPQKTLFLCIQKLTERLLAETCFSKQGIYWNKEANQIRGLCGMGHGVSGIAHVLLQMARFFSCDGLQWLCNEALDYEDAFYDKAKKNWPDYRLGIYNAEFETRLFNGFENGDMAVFETGAFMNAWCHGAPGCGLVRIEKAALDNKKDYLKRLNELLQEFNKALLNKDKTLTLCHGLGSITEYILAYEMLTGSDHRAAILGVMEAYFKQTTDEFFRSGFEGISTFDASLMNGVSGIGHLMLRLHAPASTPSVLAISLQNHRALPSDTAAFNRRFSISSIFTSMLKRIYPETLKLLPDLRPHPQKSLVKWLSGPMKITEGLSKELADRSKFYYKVEKALFTCELNTQSHIFMYVRVLASQRKMSLKKDAFNSLTLSIPVGSKLIKTRFGYPEDNNTGTKYYYLSADWKGSSVVPLGRLSYLICGYVKSAKTVGDIQQYIWSLTAGSGLAQIENSNIVTAQIRELVYSGLLVYSPVETPVYEHNIVT